MRRDHAPATLHEELHHECGDGERCRRATKGPKRRNRNHKQRRQYQRTPAPETLRQKTENKPAQDRADIINDSDKARDMRVEAMLLLEKSRIEVLRTVTEKIQAHHQQNGIDSQLPML